jgi:hypothetical protein
MVEVLKESGSKVLLGPGKDTRIWFGKYVEEQQN